MRLGFGTVSGRIGGFAWNGVFKTYEWRDARFFCL